ncbi:MAG: carboxymuconolactone decarboxylase family protein [Planctomycetales bacterium]|nr:carboxymuconolactone decarboxylase family protein [bacterium]UNM07289.1 MAG: carboxymuconolactone decarboxylase family protein [Planctomycetales bacterium]
MSYRDIHEYNEKRAELNEVVMRHAGQSMKRFWNLDGAVYREGALPEKTKELLGLVASLVLRCDDCIYYHINESFQKGASMEEIEETLSIGLIVGGSITIPHIRRAFKAFEELQESAGNSQG